ncbi:MAG: hypothetical protein IPP71_21560 [Bacteroidetes bacterium]|nr:hypothetical protein [Bacteroidota bacterium]
MIKYTPQLLKKIEEAFEENGYKVRYEKGNFKSGYCIIEDRKIVVINKFSAIENRIISLIEILKTIAEPNNFDGEKFEQIKKLWEKELKVEEPSE